MIRKLWTTKDWATTNDVVEAIIPMIENDPRLAPVFIVDEETLRGLWNAAVDYDRAIVPTPDFDEWIKEHIK